MLLLLSFQLLLLQLLELSLALCQDSQQSAFCAEFPKKTTATGGFFFYPTRCLFRGRCDGVWVDSFTLVKKSACKAFHGLEASGTSFSSCLVPIPCFQVSDSSPGYIDSGGKKVHIPSRSVIRCCEKVHVESIIITPLLRCL